VSPAYEPGCQRATSAVTKVYEAEVSGFRDCAANGMRGMALGIVYFVPWERIPNPAISTKTVQNAIVEEDVSIML
jgi:hypothetical protein